MRLSSQIAYNTLVQIISKVIATALGLVAVALMTRYLGQKGFGQYTTIVTFLSFFGIIADLGLTLITVQMISRPGANQDKILSNLLSLRLLTAIVFLGVAPLTVLFFPYDPIIKIGVAITAISFLFIALNQILVGLFQKNLRMDKVSIAEVVGRIVLVIGVATVIKLKMGLIGIMLITVAASAINFFFHYLFSRTFARIKLHFDFRLWREIITRSWPLALTIIFNLIYLKIDTLFLSLIKRPSKIGIIAEVGVYGAAYKVIDVLITFPFMFAGIMLPVLTARWAKGSIEGFKNILQKSFNVMAIIAIPLAVGTQFIAKDVMVLVAGDEFAASGPVLRILILAACLIFLGSMFAHAIIAINKQKKIISAYIFTAVTAVVGYLIFIPHYSYFGAAWVTIYSELFIALACAYVVWKYTRFIPRFNIVFKSLLASICMALVIYFIRDNSLPVVLPAAIITYSIALYAFRGITKREIFDVLSLK